MLHEDQAGASTPQQEHKHSWLGRILDQVNTEFPLSGGETNEDLHTVFSHHASAPTQEQEQTQEHQQEHKHSWLENALSKIDGQFPLSGGE